MGEKRDIVGGLEKFRKRVSRDFHVERMVFFGSRAKGKPHKWSDIDLIIVSGNFRKMDFIQRGAKMYDYWNLKYPVDFICYTPEEFKERSKQITIVRHALDEGVEIA